MGRRSGIAKVGLLVLVWATAACANQNLGPTTVSVRQAGDASVLVDATGMPLYTTEQEADGSVRCVAECLTTWPPLLLPDATATPSASGDVPGKVGTLTRPDGTRQVTYDGRPLYRFFRDAAGGAATGEGTQDTFGGTPLAWHVVAVTGAPPADGGGGY